MQENREFCPQCGTAVSPDDAFCPNCGYNLVAYRQWLASRANQQPTNQPFGTQYGSEQQTAPGESMTRHSRGERSANQPGQSAAPKKPMPKSRKVLLWTAGIIVLILAGGYYAGSQHFSRQNQLDQAVAAFTRGDAQTSVGYLTTDDPKLALTAKNVAPLMKMFQKNPTMLRNMRTRSLPGAPVQNYQGGASLFAFVQSGRRMLFFPAYKFKFIAVYPHLTTNLPSEKVTIGGQVQGSGKMKSKEVGPLVPGNYQIVTTIRVNDKTVKNVMNRDLTNIDSDLDLSFSTISFIADGYPGAEVRLNGNSLGHIGKDGTLAVKQYPSMDRLTKMTQVYTADGKKVTSAPTDVGGLIGDHVGVSYPGVITEQYADTLLDITFDDVHQLVSNGSSDDKKRAESLFVGGKDNKVYQALHQSMKGYEQNKNIDLWDCKTRVDHVYPKGKDQARVLFNVTWSFKNHDDVNADGSQLYHVQTFAYEGEIDRDAKAADGDREYVIKDWTMLKKTADRKTDDGLDY